MRIKQCSVHVTDPASAFDFYTQILGFEEVLKVPESELYLVRAPEDPFGTGLMLEPTVTKVGKTYQEGLYRLGLPAIVFGVADVQAEHDRLVALGVRFVEKPSTTASGTSAEFDDTCGNVIQIHQD